jgi:hypothetical protein
VVGGGGLSIFPTPTEIFFFKLGSNLQPGLFTSTIGRSGDSRMGGACWVGTLSLAGLVCCLSQLLGPS